MDIKNIEIKNAVIESASITIEEQGFLTTWVHVYYGDFSQGFGGKAMYLPEGFDSHTVDSPGGHIIYKIMEIAGVQKWSDLPGRPIRVKSEYTKIHAIGNFIKEDWFSLDDI